MFELIFVDRKTGDVVYAVTDVTLIRYITPSEVGFMTNGRDRSCSFTHSENLEVKRIERFPLMPRYIGEPC